jgi:large subunit ribosomal protein L31
MKQGIHPTYYKEATVTCVCGAVLTTGSTIEKMNTEICSSCHPFYTGKKKFIDAGGRVDRFKRMTAKVTDTQKQLAGTNKKKAAKDATSEKTPKKAAPTSEKEVETKEVA